MVKGLDKKTLEAYGVNKGFQWCFSATNAPGQNGISEALIRSIKWAITTAIEQKHSHILFECANLVNEWLTGCPPISQEDSYFCQNDLLLSRASSPAPSGPFSDSTGIKQRFELDQQISNSFWKRWTKDYCRSFLTTEKAYIICGINLSLSFLKFIKSDKKEVKSNWWETKNYFLWLYYGGPSLPHGFLMFFGFFLRNSS